MVQANKTRLSQDLLILVASIAVAVLLSQTEMISVILGRTMGAGPLEAFIAGIFFTSAFTTAPAIVVLGKLAQSGSLPVVALFGALGAVCGDFLIFKFVRDRLGVDLQALLNTESSRRFRHIVHSRLFRWFSPFVAAVIIASPFPDELAIAILGLVGERVSFFLPFSFMANALGIVAIGLIARTI